MAEDVHCRTVQTIVFDVGGRPCTELTVRAAVRRAMELKIGHVLIATSTGWSASKLVTAAREAGYQGQLVAIAEHTGYHSPGVQALSAEAREELETAGVKTFFGTHAFSSIPRSFRFRYGGIDMAETVAETLRRVSRGTKVCFEIAVMAADASLVPVDRDIVAIGGSGGGSDTAVVIRPANMNSFFDLKVREFIAMPRLRVAEVMGAAIELSRQGASADEVASKLDVSPSTVGYYLELYSRVKALVAEGLSLTKALEQAGAGRQGEVASTLKHLFKE